MLDIEDLRGWSERSEASSEPQFDLVINTGGPLMQDTCNRVATKRVITTLSSAPQIQVDYNVFTNFLSRFGFQKIFLDFCYFEIHLR